MELTYFNPNSLKEADFLQGFVARQRIFDFLLNQLTRISTGGPANHYLIVAPRGFGKTSLLRRIAIGVRTDKHLHARFIALRFREEQHNVLSLDVFWRNCLQSLTEAREDEGAPQNEIDALDAAWAMHAPRQSLSQDEQDGEPAWQALSEYCEHLQRRPLLLIDNLDTLLAGLNDRHQWSLRKRLQSDNGPILIAAASRYPDATHDQKAAFYEFFRIHPLDKLDDREVFACLRNLAMHRGTPGQKVLTLLEKNPGRIAALNTLAGGNPRTLSVLYGVLESDSGADVLSQLTAMLDTFTGWYQARTEELSMHARAVFDALALNWDPMTAAALGQATGLDTSAVSSHLNRLEKNGYVEQVALRKRGKGRSGYQVSERFFNIWYLMRNGPRRARQSIRFLTSFLQSCYSPAERRALALATLKQVSSDPGYALALAGSLGSGRLRQQLLDQAYARSNDTDRTGEYGPIIDELRKEVRPQRESGQIERAADDPETQINNDDDVLAFNASTKPTLRDEVAARALVKKGIKLGILGQFEQAIEVYDDVVARFGTTTEAVLQEGVARALFNKGIALRALGQSEQEIAVYDDVVARFATATEPVLREGVARALINKGTTLGALGQPEQEIAVYDDVVSRFAMATEPALRDVVAKALINKGITLRDLGQPEQAIEVYNDALARFGTATEATLREQVAKALINKGVALGALSQPEKEIAVYDDLVARFATAAEPALRERVSTALINKGIVLGTLGQPEQEIAVYDDVVSRFATATELALRKRVARALINKGITLRDLGRPEQALEVYDDVVARFATATEPALREGVARALINKGIALRTLARPEQALEVYDDVVARFATATELALREAVARALFNKGIALRGLGQREQEIAIYDDVVARFDMATELSLRERVARTLINKGITLRDLGQREQEIAVYDDVVARFGTATELALREQIARALINKGVALGALSQPEKEIAVYDDVVVRFATATESALRERVAKALINKGITLRDLDQPEQEIAVYDDVVAHFGTATELALREQVARALINKGIALGTRDQPELALDAFDDVVARFGTATESALRERVARALINKGLTLDILNRPDQEIAVYDDVVDRFSMATEPSLQERVSWALINKGLTFGALGQREQEIAVYDDVVARFGTAASPLMRERVAIALDRKANSMRDLGRFDASEAAYRAAIELQATVTDLYVGLGNLLLDFKGQPANAVAAFEGGLEVVKNQEDRAILHENMAYALALHNGDRLAARAHANRALEDGTTVSPAGRLLLEALPIWNDRSTPDWLNVFEKIGMALTCEDPALWSSHSDDLQRLLAFILIEEQGPEFKRWMSEAQFSNQYAPLYHAFVAALEGEDHLLQINPETRQPALKIYEGIVHRLKLDSVQKKEFKGQ